jgi:hypothetical protein
MSIASWIRRVAVVLWTFPTTSVAIPLLFANGLCGGRSRIVQGVLEAHGPFLRFLLQRCTPLKGGASAMTLGHVVIGCDADTLARTRAHERVHVRQAERWGPLFFPAYGVASLIAWRRGENVYLDNRFEREAYEQTSIDPPNR